MSSLLSGIPFILDEGCHPAIYFEDNQWELQVFQRKKWAGENWRSFKKFFSNEK
jgi:hypothetical protein